MPILSAPFSVNHMFPSGPATTPSGCAGEAVANSVIAPAVVIRPILFGNLWITDGANNRIGSMTTAGAVTWFAAPIGLSLDQIVAGSDGALWFAGSTAIARVTTSGTVTLYQLPASAGASDVALGPDGNVWYTDGSRSIVGRVTPSGVITEFPTPSQPSRPVPISEAADGGVWFGETSNRAFDESGAGRAAPDGTMTQQPLTTQPANPQFGVAAGPDGNVWMTEYYGFAVARIKLPTPSTCTPLTATASPPTVRHAAPEVLRATIANCANRPQVMSLTTNVTSKSRCSSPSTVSTSVPLQPLVKTVVSDAFKAPRCKGTYTATMTLNAGGTVLATTTVNYKVT